MRLMMSVVLRKSGICQDHRRKSAVFLATIVLLGGCATVPADPYEAAPAATQLARDDAVGDCLRTLKALDERIEAAGRRDAQDARVPGYPYLRVDRFTAGWSAGGNDAGTIAAAKVDRMAALDAEARRFEAANVAARPDEVRTIEHCRTTLVASARASAADVVGVAKVPDSYSTTQRVLGLYPLTAVPFSWGVAAWQQTTRELFSTPFPDVPVLGERIRYVPGPVPANGPLAGEVDEATAAALHIPMLTKEQTWKLVARHAPVLTVDTVDGDDRIGTLGWRASPDGATLVVNTKVPAAYVRSAWTEVNGEAALQLVYTFWFPARPPAHPLDLVAGHLDAVVWRVTLDTGGRPLVYDSIHACGCFHMFFPTQRVRERPGPLEHEGPIDETMFSPQVVYSPSRSERVMVFLGSHDHNIERVGVDSPKPAPGVAYRLIDENVLRSLPVPAVAGGGTRSIYGPDGLVPGSERPERFVYWPMGVPSAGQMRQWGHHATAFVGRRHFDDPRLIDRYFSLAPGVE
jgi:hypothetical protein